MIKKSFNFLRAVFVLAIISGSITKVFAADIVTKSPDGNIELKIFSVNGQLNYVVSFMRQPVIETSPLNMFVDGDQFMFRRQIR